MPRALLGGAAAPILLAVLLAGPAASGRVAAPAGASAPGTSSGPLLWTRDHTGSAHPPGLIGPSMAYDAADGYVVLFGGLLGGGSRGVAANETWTFSAGAWTELHPAVAPPARADASMTYDPAMHAVVLFGGLQTSARGRVTGAYHDTWKFSAGTWSEVHPAVAPLARYDAAMTYDGALHAVVLAGGTISTRAFSGNATDFWEFAHGNWTELTAFNPVLVPGISMGYDPHGHVVVVYSYSAASTYRNGTWTNRPASPGPPLTWQAPFVYDPARGDLLLIEYDYRPNTPSVEVWRYAGTRWTNLTQGPQPPVGVEFAAAYDAADGYTVLYGGSGIGPTGHVVYETQTWELR